MNKDTTDAAWHQLSNEEQRRIKEEQDADWEDAWKYEAPPWTYWDRVKEYWNEFIGN